MAAVKVGDYVRVSDREATSADAKTGLFYNYFRNLTGTVERVYDDNSVCVDVEIESLPQDIRDRHIEIQTMQRDKWINGLSQEQRNKLSEQDKQFNMSYKIVVSASDVLPAKKGSKPQKKADTAVKAVEETSAKDSKAETKASKTKEETTKRLTEEDLSAAEEEFLKSRGSKNGK